ncbi:MAG TPA: tetratricopeptide repeat protein [Polyangiaceae bacterium]|nr:tetratricopeptide repeat protein [Polyangiaceae bacterium]
MANSRLGDHDLEQDASLGSLRPEAFSARPSVRPTRPPESEQPPSAPFDGEDFLFHLYRGSELLQDNCAEEAKEELERALRMQPLDVEGQGLLGAVYFRLGLYPRAIEIYRDVIRACPDEVTPKLNLALCCLKTGQPSEARDLLEEVLRRAPEHRRAWGYLGLSFERLGEYGKALSAFERADQPHLARRMQQLLEDVSAVPSERNPPREELRRAAANAVEELDAGSEGGPFERAEPEPDVMPLRDGRWQAHEPGEEPMPPLSRALRPSLRASRGPAPLLELSGSVRPVAPEPAPARPSLAISPEELVASRQVMASQGHAERTAEGLVFLPVRESFAVRAERVRAVSPEGDGLKPSPLKRRVRGRETDEGFAGTGSSWVMLEGRGLLVLEPGRERELMLLRLAGEFVYLREARLVGFEGLVRYENGRLPAADPGPVPMVQLAGEGVVVFEARAALAALTVNSERALTVRAASVLGWTGRLLGQAVTPEQAPHLGSGFVTFSGDGAVLVDDP